MGRSCRYVSAGFRRIPRDLRLLEHIAANGGPTVQICRASEATVILKVQLGQGVTLAGEGFARTVAIDATVWKPIDDPNGVSSIKAVWLESNPKRALLRLVGTARNLVAATRTGPIPVNQGNYGKLRRDF